MTFRTRFWPALILILLLAVPSAAWATDKKTGPAQPAPAQPQARWPIYHFPDKLTLCGERIPLDNPRVWEMLDREFQINVYDTTQVIMWAKRARRYFPRIEAALAKAGLPDDLKYLAVAESALKVWAYSYAGAAGPWQFIRSTGRRYGLRRTAHFDNRLDFDRSTQAAIRYLTDLHQEFGRWTLAMAAYNCGEERVAREIKEQGVNDYFRLNLPLETERYVFRILTAKIILSHPDRYGYDLSRVKLYEPIATKLVRVESRKPVHVRHIAQAAGTYFKEIKELNPAIRGYYLPPGRHSIYIPAEGAPGFDDRLAKLTSGSRSRTKKARAGSSNSSRKRASRYYVVKKGDTLAEVSARLNVSIAYLKRVNNLRSSLIKIGQKLTY